MRDKERALSYAPLRIAAIMFGAFWVMMGREALSQGYIWTRGYNARLGTETTGTTLSWIVTGILFILAGIFPWRWLVNRGKRRGPQ